MRISSETTTHIAIGSMLGIAAFGTFLYYIAHIIPLHPIIIWITLLGFMCEGIALLLFHRNTNTRTSTDWHAAFILLLASILFAIIGSKLLIERPDGLYTGIINAYGDIGWHTALIMELADTKKLPVQDPIFAGTNLTYPFLSNFISSAMILIGSSIAPSMNLPAMFLIPLIILLLYHFGKLYGRSRGAGILVLLLFLFGGATFGWTRIFTDAQQSNGGLIHFFTHLPNRDYSGVGGDAAGFNFLNPTTSLLLPQRAMLFGLPIVLCTLILLHPTNIKRKHAPIIAGILAGMLPLFHAHACIALAAGIVALIITNPIKKYWVHFFIPALLLGIPELFFYAHGSASSGSFLRLAPGWMKEDHNFFLFWLQNTGIFIPASILLFFTKLKNHVKALAIAGSFLFAAANIFLFAPWAWDNFKILVFWLLFILPGIAWLFMNLWNMRNRAIYLRPILIIFLLLQTGSGVLDIWKLSLPTATTWQEWDRAAMVFAQYMKGYVPPQTPIATASVHNSPAVLAGKLLFLGYPAHIWSHGVSPWVREAEIKEFYTGSSQTIANKTPQYILVGPQELAAFPNLQIQPRWKKIAQYGAYSLFRQ